MRLYIGVDFHPHRQTVCWMDEETGELRTKELLHNTEEVKGFYKAMPGGGYRGEFTGDVV